MSKAIVIKKNGISQNLTVDKLRTNGADGQSIDWVPEDTVQLVALNATANGTYTPTGGKYGYEYAAVSVPGSVVTGKKPDGNTYVYTKDGSGALVETKVPTEIRITTSPTNVGPYGQGANIDFNGIVVKAYYADGTEYGEIPFADLTLPVTVAGSPSETEEPGLAVYGDKALKWCYPGSIYHHFGDDDKNLYGYAVISQGLGIVYAFTIGTNENDCQQFVMCDQPFEGTYRGYNNTTTELNVRSYNNVYYAGVGGAMSTSYPNPSWYPETSVMNLNGAIECLYSGDISQPVNFQVPVQWQRPGDGMVLETSYGICIIPSPSEGNN